MPTNTRPLSRRRLLKNGAAAAAGGAALWSAAPAAAQSGRAPAVMTARRFKAWIGRGEGTTRTKLEEVTLKPISGRQVVVRMLPMQERRAKGMRSQSEALNAMRRDLLTVAGARVFARAFGMFPGQRTEPLQFVLSGPNLPEMGRLANTLQRRLQGARATVRTDHRS